jgi:hypothetical protein
VNTYTLLEQDTFNMKRFVTRSKKSPQRRGKIPPRVGEKVPSNHCTDQLESNTPVAGATAARIQESKREERPATFHVVPMGGYRE